MDILTAGSSFFSFGIFLLVHLTTFRWVRPEHLLRSLLLCVIGVMALPMVLMGIFYILKTVDASLLAWVCAAILASLIQGLLCFVYVLCVFGPYETSVRMRLVREIALTASGGISMEELSGRYNHQTIVNLRLQRLVGSGDIVENNGLYRAGRRRNFFFIFDAIAGVLKKWIDR
jgi:hypothetical protein